VEIDTARVPLATLKLHHDALGISLARKDNPEQHEVVRWLFELGEQFAWLGMFLSTVATEIEKGEHGHSSILVCYRRGGG